jgi:anti-sigma factor RsiW
MECNQMRELISAYADNELDAQQRAEAERHLGDCGECAQSLKNIQTLKTAMRNDVLLFNVPIALRKKIDSMVAKAVDPPTGQQPRAPRRVFHIKHFIIATAAAVAVAASITAYVVWPTARQRIETQAVREYNQSLPGESSVGFPSTDPKTVSHWLSTQLNFAPVMANQLPASYTLAGGRIDMLDGRKVAVLVYRSGLQTSNLFQWPSTNSLGPASVDTIAGRGVTAWNAGGMTFAIVSDAGTGAIQQISAQIMAQGCEPQ